MRNIDTAEENLGEYRYGGRQTQQNIDTVQDKQ